jgi:hypothetical protein
MRLKDALRGRVPGSPTVMSGMVMVTDAPVSMITKYYFSPIPRHVD